MSPLRYCFPQLPMRHIRRRLLSHQIPIPALFVFVLLSLSLRPLHAGREFCLDSFSRFGYTVFRRTCVGSIFAADPGSESPGGVGSSFFEVKRVDEIPVFPPHDVQIKVIYAVSVRLCVVYIVDRVCEVAPAFRPIVNSGLFAPVFAVVLYPKNIRVAADCFSRFLQILLWQYPINK